MTPSPAAASVLQIGGAGSVAGGLSQVVAQLDRYQFADVEVTSAPTRDLHSARRTVTRSVVAVAQMLRRAPRRTGRPGVVAAHLSQRGSFLREGVLCRLAALIGWRYVIHLHGSDFARFAARRPRLARAVLGRADRVLVLSDETAAVVSSLCPSGPPVVRVSNTVPLPAEAAKAPTVVFGGEVGHRKGFDVLTEAWRRLQPSPDWMLHVYGPVVTEVPTLNGMVVHGPVPNEVLVEALRRSSVAVLPSRAEALPMFLLEAMAARNAVISTPVGAIPDLLDGDAGVLVPVGDADALTTALGGLLADPDRVEKLGAAARERIALRYDRDAAMHDIEQAWLGAAGCTTSLPSTTERNR